MKKLEFNETKCVKLHICREERKICPISNLRTKKVNCVFLEVQDCEMRSADSEKYIGDLISSNGSNDINISRRRSQGIGAISQIFSILNEISLGYHYIEIGLILRESVLLSKMTLRSEAWHKVHKYQIENWMMLTKCS